MADGTCPGCGHPNAAGARFCGECGAALGSRPCPSCGTPSSGGRFCQSCGAFLADAAAGAPTGGAAQGGPRVFRKTTSVLFGDLVGFTPLSENRDVEDVRDLLSAYFQRCRIVIGRYGGTVEKFIGDAVMAVWGVPAVHEDDAERAVRAGLELTAAIAALGAELGLTGLALRVGVVTGEVAVTEGAAGEGMVAGDAVNTAARVQSVAVPGHVWVDEATRDRAASAIDFADLGSRALKGKAREGRLYEARAVIAAVGGARRIDGLSAPLTGRTRELSVLTELFHATGEAQQPRLLTVSGTAGVGKSRLGAELEFYLDGLSSPVWWHRGRCPAYGDAVAFAALTEAFRNRLEIPPEADSTVVDSRLADGMRRYVSDEEQRRWLEPRLAALLGGSTAVVDVSREELFAAWTAFLGSLSALEPPAPGSAADAARAPVVLIIEDAQHADDGLLDFLEHAVDRATFPLFLLVLARPELVDRRPTLTAGPRRSSLHLEPLPDAQVGLMVDHLVGELPGETRERLIGRAEGIPLFAVETVRWLIDRGAVSPRAGRYLAGPEAEALLADDAAPGTIEALVAARIDELDAASRSVLMDAAVLGQRFDLSGLAALGHPPSVAGTVAGLVRRDLVRPAPGGNLESRTAYAFTQAVTRTVSYRTLARKDRRWRHLAVADHLAAQPDPAREVVGAIAQHLFDAVAEAPGAEDSLVVDRAVALLERGAKRALDLCAPREALALVDRGLAAVGPESSRGARLHDLAAEAHIQTGDLDRAGQHTGSAVESYRAQGLDLPAARCAAALARAMNQHDRNAEALHLVGPWLRLLDARRRAEPVTDELEDTYLMVLVRVAGALVWPIPREGYEDLAPAAVAMLDAVTLAERRGNREESAMALNSLSVHCALQGAPEVSALLLEKAARDERDAGRPATEMFMLINLCGLYLPIDLQRAAEAVDRAAALGRLAPIQPRLDMIAALGAVVCWLSGDWPAAVDRARSVQGTIPYSAACAPAVAALVAAATGDPAAVKSGGAASDEDPGRHAYLVVAEEMPRQRPAVDRLSGAIQALLSADGLTEDFWLLWPVAVDAALDAGDVSAAEALVRLVETVQARELPPLGAAQYARLRGSVRLARGDGAQAAEPDLRRAVAALDAFGAPFYAARARLALAQALRGGGCPDQAREWETVAEQTLSDLGATPWHRRAGRSRRAGLREDAVGG